jgi:hypothetical protein
VLTGAVAAAVFGLTRWLVLRRECAAKLAFWVLPPAVLVTVMINVFFVCECPYFACIQEAISSLTAVQLAATVVTYKVTRQQYCRQHFSVSMLAQH